MRALLLAVLLFALPAHAQSFLEIHFQCGKPIHISGWLDGTYLSVSVETYAANSEVRAFFEKVYADLPRVDGKRQITQFSRPLPYGLTCPVSA